MLKKFAALGMLVLFLLSLISFKQKTRTEPPNITVSINGQTIEAVRVTSDINAEGKNEFAELFEKHTIWTWINVNSQQFTIETDFPYFKLGSKIEIAFSTPPNKLFLQCYDYLLSIEGLATFERVRKQKLLFVHNKNTSFVLPTHPSSPLSSVLPASDELGRTLRGFSFSLKYNDKEYTYAFVIKTDTSKPVSLFS